MSNWYNKLSKDNPKTRWSFSVEADVWVPESGIEEEEKNLASKVLRTVLQGASGDASLNTAIDSYVGFEIQFEPLKR